MDVRGGTLERVDVANFPSLTFDVYATVDAELDNKDVENKALDDSLKACEHTLDTATYAELDVTVQSPRAVTHPTRACRAPLRKDKND